MEDKLKQIIVRIENSSLEQPQKEEIYDAVADALRTVVLPTFLKYLPPEQLRDLASNPGKVTIETFGQLISKATKNPAMLEEINQQFEEIINKTEEILTKYGI